MDSRWSFMPHGQCMMWDQDLLLLHVIADVAIGLSYLSIPVVLFLFVNKRRDIGFKSVFILFGLFILSCSLTHFFSIYTLWHPEYWIEGWLKVVCAAISLVTAVAMWKLLPAVLKIPTTEAYEKQRVERQRAEEEATVNETRLIEAQKIAKLGHWSYEPEKDHVTWSAEVFRMFELDPAQGVPGFEEQKSIFTKASWTKLAQHIEDCVTEQKPYDLELKARRSNGKMFTVNAIGKVVETREGKVIRLAGTIQDISKLKQLERSRHESEQRFQNAFKASSSGYALVGLDGRWLEVNDTLCDIVGYSKEELLELTFQDITFHKDLQTDLKLLQQLMDGEIPHYNMEKRYICKDRSLVWIELSVSLVRRADGDPHYFVSQITDIDDKKKAEAQKEAYRKELERSNSELDHFAYVASHDLKSPLRAIQNLAMWIQEDCAETLPDESQNDLRLLKERAGRMEGLLDALLQYSRVGRKESQPTAIDVDLLLSDILATLDVPEDVKVKIRRPLPTIQAPEAAITRIFSNLISNAVKHRENEQLHIEVSCREVANQYEFCIADDGPGIDPQFHTRIFDLYQTLKSRDEKEASGIGLALVKKTVEHYGGSVRLESEQGKGASFYFTWSKDASEQTVE